MPSGGAGAHYRQCQWRWKYAPVLEGREEAGNTRSPRYRHSLDRNHLDGVRPEQVAAGGSPHGGGHRRQSGSVPGLEKVEDETMRSWGNKFEMPTRVVVVHLWRYLCLSLLVSMFDVWWLPIKLVQHVKTIQYKIANKLNHSIKQQTHHIRVGELRFPAICDASLNGYMSYLSYKY
jgi:hypothetical protein